MKGTGYVDYNGNIRFEDSIKEYLKNNPDTEADIEIHVLSKPQHFLYKYLDGILIKDIASHSGMSHDEIKDLMKQKFATLDIKNLEEIPRRHRGKRTQIIAMVNTDNEIMFYRWIKSCSYMTHEELKEFVVNVENHFFDFMEGALAVKDQLKNAEYRKIGMMDNKEYKKYKGIPSKNANDYRRVG